VLVHYFPHLLRLLWHIGHHCAIAPGGGWICPDKAPHWLQGAGR